MKELIVSQKRTARPPETLPDTYFEWVGRHPLQSIQSDDELEVAQAVLDELLRTDLDAGGIAYLNDLSDLVGVYERGHHAIPPLPPHQLLAHLLGEHGLSQVAGRPDPPDRYRQGHGQRPGERQAGVHRRADAPRRRRVRGAGDGVYAEGRLTAVSDSTGIGL
jgi:hypothetical protein